MVNIGVEEDSEIEDDEEVRKMQRKETRKETRKKPMKLPELQVSKRHTMLLVRQIGVFRCLCMYIWMYTSVIEHVNRILLASSHIHAKCT